MAVFYCRWVNCAVYNLIANLLVLVLVLSLSRLACYFSFVVFSGCFLDIFFVFFPLAMIYLLFG